MNAIQVYDRRLCGAKVCRVNAPVMDTTTLLTRSGDGSRDGQSNTTRSREALCHRTTLTLSAWSYKRLQQFDVMRVQCFSSRLSRPIWMLENEILQKTRICLNNIKVQFFQHQVGAWFSFSDPAENLQTNRLTPLCWFLNTHPDQGLAIQYF